MLRIAGAAARLVFAVFALSASANAAAYITFVASNGNDANPCTVVTAPCKTLQRAVNVTTANGTVRILTPLQNNVVINKSITISGDGAAIVGIIVINSASAVVTLRGLALNGIGGFVNGIRIDSAAAVHIENCTVEHYTDAGIKLGGSSLIELFVSDTVSRDNGGNGVWVNDSPGALVTVENSRFENNASCGLLLSAAKVNVVRSTASGNDAGICLTSGLANVTETTAANNTTYGFLFGSNAQVHLDSSVARGSTVGLALSAGASVSISETVITGNPTAVNNSGGTLYTRQNNTLGGNYVGVAAQTFAAF